MLCGISSSTAPRLCPITTLPAGAFLRGKVICSTTRYKALSYLCQVQSVSSVSLPPPGIDSVHVNCSVHRFIPSHTKTVPPFHPPPPHFTCPTLKSQSRVAHTCGGLTGELQCISGYNGRERPSANQKLTRATEISGPICTKARRLLVRRCRRGAELVPTWHCSARSTMSKFEC